MSRTAAEAAKKDWLCPGCNYPKPGVGSIDVTLQQPGPNDAPLNFIYGFGVPIAKRAFLGSFGENTINRDLHLGRVFLEGRGQLDDWVTVRGRHSLIIRGTKNVSRRQCTECGRNVYFAMGSRYLFPSPPSEHEMFESDLSGLIVSQRLFDLLTLNGWPKLVFDKLPVLAAPKDDFPEMVSTYKSE
jgi:hypothetical protein